MMALLTAAAGCVSRAERLVGMVDCEVVVVVDQGH